MKKINLLLVLLTLTSCNLNSSKGYEFAHSALDSLLNEVSYDESIEVKNALYHEYDEDSNLNEVVVTYFTYEHSEYGLMDEYLKYEYDEDKVEYSLTLGEEAEMYFYFATGMDIDNYVSLKAQNLNNYLANK